MTKRICLFGTWVIWPIPTLKQFDRQITQKKSKAKFVWLRPFAHTSNPNRTNHTNNQIKKFEWNIPLFHTDYPNTHHPPSCKWTLHSKWTKKKKLKFSMNCKNHRKTRKRALTIKTKKQNFKFSKEKTRNFLWKAKSQKFWEYSIDQTDQRTESQKNCGSCLK